LLTLIAARHGGARKIVSTDPLDNKRQMALDLGADAVIDATTDDLVGAVRAELGESADVVFDCVSHQDTFERAVRMAIKGGTVGVVGGPRRPVTLDLPVLQEYQIRLQGCATYERQDFGTAIAILASGMFDADRLITSTFPLPKAAGAFAAIGSGREAKILVVADPL
jgi:threonine dehydrogenase-like Zn-dependent dehydrogenase